MRPPKWEREARAYIERKRKKHREMERRIEKLKAQIERRRKGLADIITKTYR